MIFDLMEFCGEHLHRKPWIFSWGIGISRQYAPKYGLMVYTTHKKCKIGDGGSCCFTHISKNGPAVN
jgi:hypothetical protein